MARILKFIHAQTGEVTRFDRSSLEEFPEAERLAPAFQPVEEESCGMEEEAPPLDPEVIREEIMASAREEAALKVQEAYQEGLARGTQAGRERFVESLGRCSEALEAAAESIRTAHDQFLDTLEPQVVALVRLMATRVLEAELRTDPDLLQHTARRALSRLAGQYSVTLLVHPDDLAALKLHQVALLDSMPGVEILHVQASDAVAPGGCIAQSEQMEVDARLETLLGQVLDALKE